MTTRLVSGVALRGDETPFADSSVVFHLRTGSYTPTAIYPPSTVSTTTDEDGAWEVDLWVNGEGLTPTEWLVVLPNNETYRFVLAAGGPITLSALLLEQQLSQDWAQAPITTAMDLYRAELANTSNAALGDALVGHKDPGSGTTARTVHDKLTEFVSVLDFIPKAEYPAIRAKTTTYDFASAIAAASDSAVATGRTVVWFPPGLYTTSPTLRLLSGLTYFGPGATIKALGVGATPVLITNELYETSGYNEEITVDGLTIDGDGTAQSLMVFRNTTKLRILNTTFTGASNNAVAFGLSGLDNADVMIFNCLFKNNIGGQSNILSNQLSSDGIYAKGKKIRIIGNLFESCNDTPLAVESVEDCLVLGNIVRNDTSGLGIMGNGIAVGLNCRNITVADNIIAGVRYYGLYCHLIGGSYNERITLRNNKIISHQATTTLSEAATQATTTLRVHDAAGLVEIGEAPNFIIDDTGTPRIFYSGEIANNTDIAITQAPLPYTANAGNTIGNWARTSTITAPITEASTTISMAATSAILAKPGDIIYVNANTGARRWMAVTAVTATTLTVAQTTPAYTASPGNIVTNYFGIRRSTLGPTTTVTQASTTMNVENPAVLLLEPNQVFYVIDNTGVSRPLVAVGVSGLTITFTQTNPAFTASPGNLVRSYGEHLIATTSVVTEASILVSVASTLDMDIEPGKVIHIRDNTGVLRPLVVGGVGTAAIGFSQTNPPFTASIGNLVRVPYGGNTARHCIYVDSSEHVDVIENTCIGSYESGIRTINARHLVVERNRVIDCASNGIAITGTDEDGSDSYDIQIHRNYVENTTTDPIASYRAIGVTNARSVSCDGNVLSRNQGGGIYFQSVMGGSISWNTIDDTISRVSGTGITLLYGCQDLMISWNDINNCIRWGIDLDRNNAAYTMARITLSHNKIRSALLHGIRGQNVAGLKLDHNDISNDGESGVRLVNCTDISFDGDDISGSQATGVSITAAVGAGNLETNLIIAHAVKIINNGQAVTPQYSGFTVTGILTAAPCTLIMQGGMFLDTQAVPTQGFGIVVDNSVERFEYSDLIVWPNAAGGLSNAALNVPTIAAGTGAGTSPTVVTVTGTDRRMLVTVTTGTTPTASATVATITFATAINPAPKVVQISGANAAAIALSGTSQVGILAANTTTALFRITAGSVALAAATAYQWYVEVKE